MLVEAFSACGLGVSIATDGTLYQTEVFTASHSPAFTPSSPSVTSVSSHGHSSSLSASGRASFIIALLRRRTGRRPVLSFDPHHSRPAVPLRPFAAEPAP
ncbi:hypothetical protein B0H10DRAFT_2029390 [Mycena sp. CBHHK59/15]|nr:hypothetical protein B0H10DRAFT_2029390 [Mycena sp. CBHHK59/15]